jgi:catechol 2,3-dioxygenase-like lactoylglutathione lyase family enzyme
MLGTAKVVPTIPVTDLNKAKEFYTNTLGLSVAKESPMGIQFQAGEGTQLYIYQRGPSKADHTLAAFEVDDLEGTVDALKAKGITFEQYDFPGLKTNEKGIADSEGEGERAAWFKDPDGNILAVSQPLK